jgi:hypothetical protein
MTDLDIKIGDRITAKEFSKLPPGSEARLIHDQYPKEDRRVLKSSDNLWFENKRAKGSWQKNPLQPQHYHGVYAGDYGDFIVEKIGDNNWMHPNGIARAESFIKQGMQLYQNTDRPGAYLAVNNGKVFLWFRDSGECGGGFHAGWKEKAEEFIRSGYFPGVFIQDGMLALVNVDSVDEPSQRM